MWSVNEAPILQYTLGYSNEALKPDRNNIDNKPATAPALFFAARAI